MNRGNQPRITSVKYKFTPIKTDSQVQKALCSLLKVVVNNAFQSVVLRLENGDLQYKYLNSTLRYVKFHTKD